MTDFNLGNPVNSLQDFNTKQRSFLGHLHVQIPHQHMKLSLTWEAHLDAWEIHGKLV